MINKNQVVYVGVAHDNFWWGLYRLTQATNWEDLTFYQKEAEEFTIIGKVCVCSKSYLESALIELQDDPNQKEFAEEFQSCLQKIEICFQYWYANPDDGDFHEVSFEAERNKHGIKPRYIELWYPEKDIDMSTVEICTIEFCKNFLDMQVDTVLLKDIPPFENVVSSYKEYCNIFHNNPIQVTFTHELAESLAKQWKMSEQEVLKILKRSV